MNQPIVMNVKLMDRLVFLLSIFAFTQVFSGCAGTSRWKRDTGQEVSGKSSIQTSAGLIRRDTVNRQIVNLLDEEYAFMANLVIGNLVKSQQAVYEGRYREAEQLLLQAHNWLDSPDVLIALGNVFEVQGLTKRADSCWLAAWKMDSLVEQRAIRLPRKPWMEKADPSLDSSRYFEEKKRK